MISCMISNMVSVKGGLVKPSSFSLLKSLPVIPLKVDKQDLILLDFSKAFDRVNHMKLLHKLHQHGARGSTLSWIKAFLSGRSQTVVLEGESSSEIPVNSGVPKVLCLALYCFYYILKTYLRTYTHRSDFFADTAIYITINNHSDSDTLQ